MPAHQLFPYFTYQRVDDRFVLSIIGKAWDIVDVFEVLLNPDETLGVNQIFGPLFCLTCSNTLPDEVAIEGNVKQMACVRTFKEDVLLRFVFAGPNDVFVHILANTSRCLDALHNYSRILSEMLETPFWDAYPECKKKLTVMYERIVAYPIGQDLCEDGLEKFSQFVDWAARTFYDCLDTDDIQYNWTYLKERV